MTVDGHGTLHQGDCLEVLPTLADGSVDLVVADLPYGITANSWDCAIPLSLLWPELRRIGKPACVFVFTAVMKFAVPLVQSQIALFRYDLVWSKPSGTDYANARVKPLSSHESVLIFCSASCNPMSRHKMPYYPQKTPGIPYTLRSGRSSSNYGTGLGRWITQNSDGARFPLSVIRFSKCSRKLHPTQKPVALLSWLIATYSRPGDTVLDPTSGVATTAVAAIREGRRFICIEKDATYHALAKQRVAAEAAAARSNVKQA